MVMAMAMGMAIGSARSGTHFVIRSLSRSFMQFLSWVVSLLAVVLHFPAAALHAPRQWMLLSMMEKENLTWTFFFCVLLQCQPQWQLRY